MTLKIDTKMPIGDTVKIAKRDGRLYLTVYMADENVLMSVGVIDESNVIYSQESYDNGTNAVDFKFNVTDHEGKAITLYGVDSAYNKIDYTVEVDAPMEDTAVAKAVLGAAITKAQALNKEELLVNVNKKVVSIFRACLDEAIEVYGDKNADKSMERGM